MRTKPCPNCGNPVKCFEILQYAEFCKSCEFNWGLGKDGQYVYWPSLYHLDGIKVPQGCLMIVSGIPLNDCEEQLL